jgi:hypothetical protein
MKKLAVVLGVIGLVGCAGAQAKLADAKSKAKDLYPKVECRAKVIEPYVDMILAEDLPAVLEGLKDVEFVLELAGKTNEEVKAVKAAFAECGKL